MRYLQNESLLESALESPFQSYGGKELYPSIQAKAARLCYGPVKNHVMIDGNKRIGVHAMLVFLALKRFFKLSSSRSAIGVNT